MKLLLLLLLLPFSSFAFFEFDTGITNYQKSQVGTWWQQEYPHSWSFTPVSYSLKYWKDLNGFSIGGGYVNLGTVSMDAEAISVDSAPQPNSFPTSHWHGTGSVQGITFGIRKQVQSVFGEGGIFLNRPSWHEDIPDYVWCKDECTPQNMVPAGRTSLSLTHPSKFELGAYAGLGFKLKDFYIKGEVYTTQAHGQWPSGYRGVSPRLSIGYSF